MARLSALKAANVSLNELILLSRTRDSGLSLAEKEKQKRSLLVFKMLF